MLLTLIPRTTCCWDDLGFITISIVLSTLHQVMKYVDEEGKVRTFIAERHPFMGVENYFTDSLLYQDSFEVNEQPHPEEPEVDTEPEEECLWKINSFVTSINKLNFNTTANV